MTTEPLAFSRPEILRSDIEAVTRVLESGWITTGTEVASFEEELAAYLQVDHVVTMSSCTTAEEACLAFLDLPRGSRVAVPAWTFVSTALAVERAGCVPVFVDVDRDTLNLTEDALMAALGDEISAVVGVHFAGVPIEKRVRETCAEQGLPLVEDAAHAFGSIDDRGLIAGQGTAGACYSFYATKNLTTGEGGAIATNDPALAAFALQFRLHGMSADAVDRYKRPGAHGYDVTMPGLKANMPDILAALGRSQLERFEESQCHRRGLVMQYRSELENSDLRLLPKDLVEGSADHLLVIDTGTPERRDSIIAALAAEQIGSSVHFRPLHTFSWYQGHNGVIGSGGVAVADELDGRIMSLPLHVGMTSDDVARVCKRVLQAH